MTGQIEKYTKAHNEKILASAQRRIGTSRNAPCSIGPVRAEQEVKNGSFKDQSGRPDVRAGSTR